MQRKSNIDKASFPYHIDSTDERVRTYIYYLYTINKVLKKMVKDMSELATRSSSWCACFFNLYDKSQRALKAGIDANKDKLLKLICEDNIVKSFKEVSPETLTPSNDSELIKNFLYDINYYAVHGYEVKGLEKKLGKERDAIMNVIAHINNLIKESSFQMYQGKIPSHYKPITPN